MSTTILFVSANISSPDQPELDKEYRDIEEERMKALRQDAFELRSVLAASLDDVSRALQQHKPTVVHFSGHGQHTGPAADGRNAHPVPGPADELGERTELLLNDESGHRAPVPIEPLARLFEHEGTSVRCVVLNACNSLEQAKAIAKHVDCAIGTSRAITDKAAIAFSKGFYHALFNGDTIEEAFTSAGIAVDFLGTKESKVFVLCSREPGKSEKLRLVEPPKVQFRMPFTRNPSFVDRDEELVRLHGMLQDPQAGGRRPVILTGMGGIGKTQLAVEYALKHEESYPDGVYFINAAGDDWRPALANLAVDLDLKAENAPEAERQLRLVAALEAYLRARPEALVIFDYVENPANLETDRATGFVPANLGCRVLVTTRRRDTRFESIDVPVLPEDAAVKLLLSKREAPESAEDRATAGAICRSLGGLPLAIALAAVFLGKNPTITLASYAHRMEKYGLLATTDTTDVTSGELPTRHVAAVKATLESQWAALENADARQVLETAALLGMAADIPRARLSLLTGLASDAEDELAAPLDDALRELSKLSFIEPMREGADVRLLPPVREFVQQQIAAREAFAAACGERLGEALRDMDRLYKEVARRGIDEVLTDLRIGTKLAGAPGQARLEALSRPLDRESSGLRRWDPAKAPGFLLQQLRNRCLDMGIEEVRERAEAKLGEHRWPWLRERFPFSRDSEVLMRTLDAHTEAVNGVAVTADGRFAVSASWDTTLKVWDIETGQVLRTLEGHTDMVLGVAVTADGRFALSASADKTLKVWDLATGQVLRTLEGHTSAVGCVAVTADGRFALSASWEDTTLKVWDLATGQDVQTLEGHTNAVLRVAVTVDGRFAVSASADKTLKVWDLATGQLLRTLEGHTDRVLGVAVTEDGRFAVSASKDTTLKVWDLATGQLLRTLEGHTSHVNCVALTSEGRFAVSASADTTLKVWDLATGQVLRTLEGHTDRVLGVALTADGRFAVSASWDHTLKVWDRRNLAAWQAVRPLEGHTKYVSSVAVTSNGRLAVSGSWNDGLKVWDLATGQVVPPLGRHTSTVNCVAVTADGRFAVSDFWTKLKVWDLATGQVLRTLEGHTDVVSCVAVTADGRLAVSGSRDNTLKVWDLATGQVLRTLEGHTFFGVTSVAVTSDGQVAVSASPAKIEVWDLATGQVLRTLEGHTDAVSCVAVTADGRLAVSGSRDKKLKVWDLATGQVLRTLEGHTSGVTGVAVTSDGRLAVSVSWDETLKVWDLVEAAQPIATLETHAGLTCCATTADAKLIFAGDRVGALHVLDWLHPPSA